MSQKKYKRFPVIFDTDKMFAECPESVPAKDFTVAFGAVDSYEVVRDTLRGFTKDLFRQPRGVIRHPYIVPGNIYNQLWDWDAFFCGLGMCEEKLEYFKGSVLNFLDHIRPDGRTPHRIVPEKPEFGSLSLPLFAQWCAIAARLSGDIEWLKPWWESLCLQRRWFEETCGARRGLFRLVQWAGNGLDNDPVLYGRGPNTVGAVHVNCYHYRVYLALAALAKQLGLKQDAQMYSKRAEELSAAINEYMWDEKDGMYYHLDLSDHDDVRYQEITWELPYKVKSWACLFPLWAGVATVEKAKRVIEEHVLNPDEFLSPFGIRSLSADEPMYNNQAMGNPSNWQGPVWGMSTFLVAYGLLRSGFREEAENVATRLIDVFAADIKANGMVHEYYHGDTGKPVMRPGFLSWNLLAIRILDDIRNGCDPAAIPE